MPSILASPSTAPTRKEKPKGNFQSFLVSLLPQANPELQRQLTFKTSSTKKRKLSPQHSQSQNSDNPDIPLNSVEDRESQSPSDLPRFDFPVNADSALPAHIPSYLQSSSSLGNDYISSTASSPSAAYASLSLEGERGGDSGSDQRGSLAPNELDTRGQSPIRLFSHRAMMGGAADLPQRSSSPLKRRASDLEASVVHSSQKDDVDMISVPPSDPPDPVETTTQSFRNRAVSIDMLKGEGDRGPVDGPLEEQSRSATPPKAADTEIPPIDAQIKTVTTIIEAAAEHQASEGDKMFLVSKRWLDRVTSRGSDAIRKSKTVPEGEIGPIDNSDIIQQIIKDCYGVEFVQLKNGLGVDDFTLFPQAAWDLVMEWYGLMKGSIPIERYAHNTNPDKNGIPNIQFEFHPCIFTLHRLYGENNTINIPQKLKVDNPPAPIFVVSRSMKYNEFLKKLKLKAEIDLSKKVRLWRVPRIQPAAELMEPVANTATPPLSRPGSPAAGTAVGTTRQLQDSWTQLFLDVPSFVQLQRGDGRELIDIPDSTANAKYNGGLELSTIGLADDQTLVLEEQTTGDNFVSNHVSKAVKATSTALTRSGVHQSKSQPTSGRNSPAPSGPITRGRAQKSGRTIGTAGMSNLGNTCYMNSALQCVRSVEELTKYFLTGAAKSELNYENPLGNRGEVALAYERLLEEIYREQNPPISVTPRHFKTTIGKFAPSFSGYGQQDSQEFLGFLLDGLQEDLSRVKKKPYIEKPDSTDEMVGNPEAIREMAAKVWDITKKRDDSVIADLFTGMYKSTLVCPVCSKVSITFDPFNNLTLQLPIESSWSHKVFYFPLNDKPVIINVDIDKQASILSLKQFISSRVGVPVERLFAAEEFKSKFYKTYRDYKVASEEIQSNDLVAVYELEAKPTNWPPRLKSKHKKDSYLNNDSDEEDVPNWDDAVAERMLVPVFHRHVNPDRVQSRYHSRKPWVIKGVPHFIIVTPEEARNEEIIKRKVLEKIATFTTHQEFIEDDEADTSTTDSVDPDIVLTNGSDGDFSAGGTSSSVVATSIDGEDELVDVTMKDLNGVRESIEKSPASSKQSVPKENSAPIPRFNTRRPKFLDPSVYLNPTLQNMFELCYFTSVKEMIPSGWNVVDEDKTYATLSSRNPQLQQPVDDESSNGYELANGRGSSASSEDSTYQDTADSSTTRMVDESSEDDEPVAAASKVLPVRARSGVRVGYNKRRNRGIKTYSKKGNQPARKLQITNDLDHDAPDDGPLIRLGEGLVVDWQYDAWDAMFGASSADDNMRGMATFSNIIHLDDPELEAKKKARAQRRKNGITLDDCLNEFGKEEILSEMDTWYCPRCKEHQRASKKFELWKTPDILVMHLKRFSSSQNRRDKLDVFVDFPIEGLDLTSRVIETEEGKQEIYDLFAVDDHWGGLGGGHYTAFAKNFVDNEWYEYNDATVVKQKDPQRVVGQSAYLLFYRRRSDVPLGGPRFKQILENFDHPPQHSDDEVSESGEDQSLVGNSSLRGSSSALTGVGAAHRQANHGSADGVEMTTVNPLDLEKLPAYEAHETDDSDAAPLLMSDAIMNDGLHPSIEDEGIGMDNGFDNMTYNSLNTHSRGIIGLGNWNFDNINHLGFNSRGNQMVSGTGSDADDASDVVQHDSSADENSIRGRIDDFDNANPETDDGIPFEDPSPVPDMDEFGQASAIALQADLLEKIQNGDAIFPRPEFEVTGQDERLDVEEPAAEIHLDPTDDLKLD